MYCNDLKVSSDSKYGQLSILYREKAYLNGHYVDTIVKMVDCSSLDNSNYISSLEVNSEWSLSIEVIHEGKEAKHR